ncbi:hypothetical protein FGG78_26420 [Thioclava sp. BHET1]|nr:hypothetical protein FGG78_26420 [Thioclava sp. BHET1]
MQGKAKSFWTSQDGAISVDWVLLTFAVLLIAVASLQPIYSSMRAPSKALADNIAAEPLSGSSE